MNKDTVIQLILEAVRTEMKENWQDRLTDADKQLFEDCVKYLAEETLALALAEDEKKKLFHRKNIEHYVSALASIKAITQVKMYNSIIAIIGRVIAGIAIATGRALV